MDLATEKKQKKKKKKGLTKITKQKSNITPSRLSDSVSSEGAFGDRAFKSGAKAKRRMPKN